MKADIAKSGGPNQVSAHFNLIRWLKGAAAEDIESRYIAFAKHMTAISHIESGHEMGSWSNGKAAGADDILSLIRTRQPDLAEAGFVQNAWTGHRPINRNDSAF